MSESCDVISAHPDRATPKPIQRSGLEIDFSETKQKRPGFWRPGSFTRDRTATPEQVWHWAQGDLESAPQRAVNLFDGHRRGRQICNESLLAVMEAAA
jgi:hypothetical protein